MNKGVFSLGMAALLFFGLFTTQALAQDFCNATGHTGQSEHLNYNHVGTIGDKGYELWCDSKTTTCEATFYADGSMSCQFQGADDYLCRSGLMLQSQGKTYDQLGGDVYAEYKLVKGDSRGVDYSYVGVYGWMENVPGAPSGLVEYYIVDNTLSQWMPGDWVGDTKIAEGVTIDGGTYNVYRNTRYGPSIGGDTQFYQYFSVRSDKRDCGTINISAHMRKWEELGLKMGQLYEARVLGEAGSNNGNAASGSIDFPYANVFIGNGSTPNSSSSTVQSSASVVSSSSNSVPVVVVNLPGSIEFEDYQDGGGKFESIGDGLGSIDPNAWVEYSVNFTSAGYYDFVVRAAREDNNGNKSYLTISVDGEDIGTVSNILTTGWGDYGDFSGSSTKQVTAGNHTLRVTFDYGYINADKITFTKRTTPSSSSVKPSSSSVVPPSSSSVVPSSSSVVPPSSSSVVPSSSSVVPPSSSSVVPSSSSVEPPPSSNSVEPPPSSNSMEILPSSDSVNPFSSAAIEFSSTSNGEYLESIGSIHLSLSDRDLQVFDMQGRVLGRVRVAAGTSIEDALFAKFHRSGIYLVKQGRRMMKVRVSR